MLGLLAGALCIGFAPVLVKLIELGPTQIAVFRTGLSAVILLPWLLRYTLKARKQGISIFELRVIGWLGLAALAFAADLYCWHRTVVYLGAGLGTILANTQSLYLSIFGALFFREKLSGIFLFALLLAAAGIYGLVGEIPTWVSPENYAPGLLYGILTGLFYSVFILSLRQAEKIKLGWKTLEKLALVCALTTLLLIPVSISTGEWALPQGVSWLWVILLALGPQILGWYLISSNLPKLEVSRSGLILLAQPLFATILGALIFQENLSPIQFIGAGATLIAIWLSQVKKSKKLR